MIWRAIQLALTLTALAVPVASRADTGIEVLIDRRSDHLSLYFALPAPDLTHVFGQGAEALLGADGTVDIDQLYDGTFLVADDIFAGATLSVGGEVVEVEALSMMLHDPAFLPGFTDPYDAQVSIAVCTSPETVRGMTLADLRAYLGYFAWQVDAHEPVEISFPALGREAVTVTLRDFVDFHEVSRREVSLADGGTLTFAVAPPLPVESNLRPFLLAGIGLATLFGAGGLILRWRRRPSAIVKGS